jgi:hypothetical protein
MQKVEWSKTKVLQKNNLFIKYVEGLIKKNEDNYKNDIIDDLIHNKNNFFLQTLKKNKKYIKEIEDNNIIMKDDEIFRIKNITINKDGLLYFSKQNKKQMKITDYNYRNIYKNNIKIKKDNKGSIFVNNTEFENG